MNITDQKLRRWNVIAGSAHLIQLALILVLAGLRKLAGSSDLVEVAR